MGMASKSIFCTGAHAWHQGEEVLIHYHVYFAMAHRCQHSEEFDCLSHSLFAKHISETARNPGKNHLCHTHRNFSNSSTSSFTILTNWLSVETMVRLAPPSCALPDVTTPSTLYRAMGTRKTVTAPLSFCVSEYRKALVSDLERVVGPVVK